MIVFREEISEKGQIFEIDKLTTCTFQMGKIPKPVGGVYRNFFIK